MPASGQQKACACEQSRNCAEYTSIVILPDQEHVYRVYGSGCAVATWKKFSRNQFEKAGFITLTRQPDGAAR